MGQALFCPLCLAEPVAAYMHGRARCPACGQSFSDRDEALALIHRLWSAWLDAVADSLVARGLDPADKPLHPSYRRVSELYTRLDVVVRLMGKITSG